MYCKFFCAFSLFLLMYLTRTAGIETHSICGLTTKVTMYLTRTAGIETNGICHQIRILFTMYLTRTAGIETAQDGYKDTVTENVSYPHCGN